MTPTDVPGRYEATAEFGMAGAWQMAIQWDGPAGRGIGHFRGDGAMTTRVTLIALVSSLALGAAASRANQAADQPAGLASKYVDPVVGLRPPGGDRSGARAGTRPCVPLAPTWTSRVACASRPACGRIRWSRSRSRRSHRARTARRGSRLSWPLDLFRKAGRVGVAEREIDAARFAVADRERLLAADVRMKYGDVAAAVRELTVLDDLFAAASKQHALVAARVEQGATPPLERDMLRVELQRLESERLLQSGAVERALIDLKRTLGMAADVSLKIRDDLEQLVRQEGRICALADSAPNPDAAGRRGGPGPRSGG